MMGMSFAQELPDPTKPAVLSSSSTVQSDDGVQVANPTNGIPDVVVSAIFYSDEQRFAIIDNKMLAEGETWKNILLAKINKDSIELKNGDSRRVVKIFNTDVVEERAYVY